MPNITYGGTLFELYYVNYRRYLTIYIVDTEEVNANSGYRREKTPLAFDREKSPKAFKGKELFSICLRFFMREGKKCLEKGEFFC